MFGGETVSRYHLLFLRHVLPRDAPSPNRAISRPYKHESEYEMTNGETYRNVLISVLPIIVFAESCRFHSRESHLDKTKVLLLEAILMHREMHA